MKKMEELNKALMNLHRHFLANERLVAEEKLERRLSPFEFLHLLMSDPDFVWLRPFSALIADTDAFLAETEIVTPEDVARVKAQVESVILNPESRITRRVEHYLKDDGEFIILYTRFEKAFEALISAE